MKYNITYTPKISLKNTIKETEKIIEKIKNLFNKKYSILSVFSPSFLEEDSEIPINIEEVTRHLTFDSGDNYNVAKLLLTNTNWLRNLFDKLNLKEYEGVLNRNSTIWRDLPENPVSTIIKHNLTLQVKLPKNIDIETYFKNEIQELYLLFANIGKQIAKKYNLKDNFPEIATYVSAQTMENEFPNSSKKEREIEFAHELNCYIFENSGLKLHSGHFHTIIPIELYSQNNFYQIVFKDFVNTSVLKVASISLLANGITLSDQLSLNNKEYLKEYDFYAKQIKKNDNILEIKINIGKLIMALLQKGHISEVQPGVISEESNMILKRYKVKTY